MTGGAAFAQPEWALNGTVSYARGPFSISVQGRYIDSGINNVQWLQPGDPGYSPGESVQRQRQYGPERLLHHVVGAVHLADAD